MHADTYEVFGYVVGSNPLGHAYVVPLQDALLKINENFPTEKLSLVPTTMARKEPLLNFSHQIHDESPSPRLSPFANGILLKSDLRIPGNDILQEFEKKLKHEWKQKGVGEGQYVLTERLKTWMDEKKDGLATNCARLLQIAFANHTRSYHQPLQASQVCSDIDSCCLVFSILLDIGHPDLLDIFHASYLFDHHLPSADYYYPELKARLAAASYAPEKIDKIVADFDRNKRSYCIAELKQRSDSFHNGKWILPICKKERINNKGGTAAIWQILVKTEVLPLELKKAVPYAEIDGPDFGLVSDSQIPCRSARLCAVFVGSDHTSKTIG